MILLDTDTLTLYFAGHSRVTEKVREADEVPVTSLVSRIEVLQGRFDSALKAEDGEKLLLAQERLAAAERSLAKFNIVPFSAGAANEFDKLRQNKKLKKIGRRDLLIACIVLAQKATLVTRNLRHFQQGRACNWRTGPTERSPTVIRIETASMNDPFAQKLKDLGFELPDWCDPPSEELVARFEKRFSVSLPADYREFLIRHGGVAFGSASCPVQEPTPFGPLACVDSFYGFGPPERGDAITAATEAMDGAPSIIMIGDDLMGNLVALKCDGNDAGYVYFYDHEGRSAWTDEMFYEMIPNLAEELKQYLQLRKQGKLLRKPTGYEHFYRLGKSFTEFMDSLRPGPDELDEETSSEEE